MSVSDWSSRSLNASAIAHSVTLPLVASACCAARAAAAAADEADLDFIAAGDERRPRDAGVGAKDDAAGDQRRCALMN